MHAHMHTHAHTMYIIIIIIIQLIHAQGKKALCCTKLSGVRSIQMQSLHKLCISWD